MLDLVVRNTPVTAVLWGGVAGAGFATIVVWWRTRRWW